MSGERGPVFVAGPVVLVPVPAAVEALMWLRPVLARHAANGMQVPALVPLMEVLERGCDAFTRSVAAAEVPLLDAFSEPDAASGDEQLRWWSTSEASVAVGLSTGYLRRLGRARHPLSRRSSRGYEWDPSRLDELRSA